MIFGAKKKLIADLTTQLEAVSAEAANLRTRLDQANEAVEKIGDVETTVNRKVNSVLASIGVTKFADENFTVTPEQKKAQLLETFRSLSDAEKTDFYQKNKAEIMLAMTA